MFIAKSRGKGRFEVYRPHVREELLGRRGLDEGDLRHALTHGELNLEYQPILNLRTGEVVGMEALVRWRHPERGVMAPGAFIPLAEESGLIVPLGKWVLEEACRQAKIWEAAYPERSLTVTVNVSREQIGSQADPHRVSVVEGALRSTGLSPDRLILEIADTVLTHHSEGALERLQKLHDRGVRIALDDFGTGYSSLADLHRFPIDILKIDRAFTEALEPGSGDATVARAIVSLGTALRVQTIAEGVGSHGQVTALLEHGCEVAQGFHLSRPLAPEMVAVLLRQSSPN